jgi:hypothetical protein
LGAARAQTREYFSVGDMVNGAGKAAHGTNLLSFLLFDFAGGATGSSTGEREKAKAGASPRDAPAFLPA